MQSTEMIINQGILGKLASISHFGHGHLAAEGVAQAPKGRVGPTRERRQYKLSFSA